MILDTTYTDEELPSHVGWGHSSWQQGIRARQRGGADRLCLFHHDPEHDDAFMDKIGRQPKAARPGTIVAREGLQVDIWTEACNGSGCRYALAARPALSPTKMLPPRVAGNRSSALRSMTCASAARCSASGARLVRRRK